MRWALGQNQSVAAASTLHKASEVFPQGWIQGGGGLAIANCLGQERKTKGFESWPCSIRNELKSENSHLA